MSSASNFVSSFTRFIAVGDIVDFPVDVDAVGTVSSFVERTAAMLLVLGLVLGLVLVGTSVFDLVIRRAQDGRKISLVCVFSVYCVGYVRAGLFGVRRLYICVRALGRRDFDGRQGGGVGPS